MVTLERKKNLLITLLSVLLILTAVLAHYALDPWGFYWKVSPEEKALRLRMVSQAESWLDSRESDGSHIPILEIYNSHEPLAVSYTVQPEDSWCATFVSAMAILEGYTQIIPTECSCGRQIELFQSLDRWEERDDAIPLPGDLIYYDWNMTERGECRGWPEHVGLVVGTKWPFVKVIEGNKDDSVSYRVILLDDKSIRGFGKPDYAAMVP